MHNLQVCNERTDCTGTAMGRCTAFILCNHSAHYGAEFYLFNLCSSKSQKTKQPEVLRQTCEAHYIYNQASFHCTELIKLLGVVFGLVFGLLVKLSVRHSHITLSAWVQVPSPALIPASCYCTLGGNGDGPRGWIPVMCRNSWVEFLAPDLT